MKDQDIRGWVLFQILESWTLIDVSSSISVTLTAPSHIHLYLPWFMIYAPVNWGNWCRPQSANGRSELDQNNNKIWPAWSGVRWGRIGNNSEIGIIIAGRNCTSFHSHYSVPASQSIIKNFVISTKYQEWNVTNTNGILTILYIFVSLNRKTSSQCHFLPSSPVFMFYKLSLSTENKKIGWAESTGKSGFTTKI